MTIFAMTATNAKVMAKDTFYIKDIAITNIFGCKDVFWQLFDDVNITENSFSKSTTDSMVSPSLKLFFTNDLVNGESCYTFAINNHSLLKLFHSTVKPDGDESAAFINELRVTDVRVKEGTVPTEYVSTTGWSIRSYWMQRNSSFLLVYLF